MFKSNIYCRLKIFYLMHFSDPKTTSSTISFYKTGESNTINNFFSINAITLVQGIGNRCRNIICFQNIEAITFIERKCGLIHPTTAVWNVQQLEIGLHKSIFTRRTMNGIKHTIEMNNFAINGNRKITHIYGEFFSVGSHIHPLFFGDMDAIGRI